MIEKAAKETGEVKEALVEKDYENLRGLCEVVVEQELLFGVTRRYEPNVRMTVLPQIKGAVLKAAFDEILPVFEECCRTIASHPQPLETLNIRPTLDGLKRDFKRVNEAVEGYQ